MTDVVLVDNDVVLKTSCYTLVDETFELLSLMGEVAVLGAARFVLPKRLSRNRDIVEKERAAGALQQFLTRATTLEPDERELSLAADLEEAARNHGVALDGGESLLLAILIFRSAPIFLTGDKRAIAAAEILTQVIEQLANAAGRIGCLEQLILSLVCRCGSQVVRERVCREPAADKALSLCFSCSSATFTEENAVEGLHSYVSAVRRSAPTVLVSHPDLLFLVA